MRDYDFYCPFCEIYLYQEEATGGEDDPHCPDCEHPVQGPTDPQYPPGGYDTLEEMWL